MNNTLTRQEIEAWQQYSIGKPSPKHPHMTIKNGKYGLWCGTKNGSGSWCDGGWPTEEWLNNFRQKQNVNNASN